MNRKAGAMASTSGLVSCVVSFVTGHGVREVAVWRGATKMIENMQKLIEDEAMAYFRADVCLGSPESFSLDEKREICEQMESTSDGRGCMMSAREPANLDDARAQAAERLLERKRLGLESAIEALEAVGYRVIEREGRHAVADRLVRTVAVVVRFDELYGEVPRRLRVHEALVVEPLVLQGSEERLRH
jgi:hypothetical protein